MIITCDSCSAKFKMDDSKVKPTGTKVRCSKCKTVFVAYPKAAAVASPEVKKDVREESDARPSVIDESGFSIDLDTSETKKAVPEGDDFDLDNLDLDNLDLSIDSGGASGSDDVSVDLSDELDLEIDFDLTEPESGRSGKASASKMDDDLDLDLDFDLESEPAKEMTVSKSDDLELNLDLDIGLELDKMPEPAKQAPASLTSGEMDLELDLGIDLSADTPVSQEKKADESLDLDLDLSLDTSTPEPAKSKANDDFELEFDLDLEEPSSKSTVAAEKKDSEEGFELDLDLDLGLDEKPKAVSASKDDFELDLDLGLEESPSPSKAAISSSSEDLDLDLDLGLDDGDSVRPDLSKIKEEDLNLDLELDLEKLESKPEADDIELEFDIQSEESLEIDKSEGDLDFSLDLDIDEPSGKDSVKTKTAEFELDLDLDDDFAKPQVAKEPAKEVKSIEATVFADDFNETSDATIAMPEDVPVQHEAAAPIVGTPHKPAVVKPRKESSKVPMLIFLLVIIIAAGAYYAVFIQGIGKETLSGLPYIGKLMGGKVELQPDDASGTLKINFVDYRERFVKNAKEGDIFIIEGKVINNYNMPRSKISISGKIFNTKKQMAQQKVVFAGNLIPNTELASLDMAEIEKRLANEAGINGMNTNVPSGKEVPFMIVFSKLPTDLENYSVEVVKSF